MGSLYKGKDDEKAREQEYVYRNLFQSISGNAGIDWKSVRQAIMLNQQKRASERTSDLFLAMINPSPRV